MVDKEAVEYFDSWKNPVVRELAPMMPGATPSKMAKSCCNEISAAEMWNRTSGYRVHTGYDNGTNTSGIWFWSVNKTEREISVEWPGTATADYDSMALADVIDSCN